MRDRFYVSSGECFQVDKHFFGIAETESGYTLYRSRKCPDPETGNKEWANLPAGADAPAGWKAISDPIPADKQHDVKDCTAGDFYFLKGCTDTKIFLRW
mgnify:CR=1 FL=1